MVERPARAGSLTEVRLRQDTGTGILGVSRNFREGGFLLDLDLGLNQLRCRTFLPVGVSLPPSPEWQSGGHKNHLPHITTLNTIDNSYL